MRDNAVMTMPSAKYSCSGSPLMFVKGSTAMEGLSGRARAGFTLNCGTASCSPEIRYTLLAVYVNRAEAERTLLKPPATWQAYDYYLQAANAHISFLSSWKVS